MGLAALLHFSAKRSQPMTTGPEDDYAQHYAAENGSTSANSTKYLSEIQKERRLDFCTQICVKGAHKAGDKSPLSSSTRKFELKICFVKYVFLPTAQRRKMGLFFVVDITVPNARHDW